MRAPEALRRPLGLVLSGGGALGAWQGGFLAALERTGLAFDGVLGFSIGALNGAAFWLGRCQLMADVWKELAWHRALRPSVRLRPLSLFSDGPIREVLRLAGDEESARREARCPFTVVSLCLEESRPIYAGFNPGGTWDLQLGEHLVASCSIPWVFPPVRLSLGGRTRTLIDGGVPGSEPLSFAALASCRDVVVLEMMRPDEAGRRRLWPWRLEQAAREGLHRSVSNGLAALRRVSPQTRVLRVYPSRVLDFTMLSFSARHCAGAFELGRADAARFLEDPAPYLA